MLCCFFFFFAYFISYFWLGCSEMNFLPFCMRELIWTKKKSNEKKMFECVCSPLPRNVFSREKKKLASWALYCVGKKFSENPQKENTGSKKMRYGKLILRVFGCSAQKKVLCKKVLGMRKAPKSSVEYEKKKECYVFLAENRIFIVLHRLRKMFFFPEFWTFPAKHFHGVQLFIKKNLIFWFLLVFFCAKSLHFICFENSPGSFFSHFCTLMKLGKCRTWTSWKASLILTFLWLSKPGFFY